MKALIFFTVILALTGCVSEERKPKVYRHEIKFHQPEKLKILYTEPEKSAFEKFYRAHPIETDIAEIKFETHRIRKVTAHMEKFLKEAEERLKKFQEFAARKKAEIAEIAEYRQQMEEMQKELKQIDSRLQQKRKKQELEYGY